MLTRRQQILASRPRRQAVRRTTARQPVRGRPAGRRVAPMPFDSRAQREMAELGNEAADTRASLTSRYQQDQEEAGLGEESTNPYSHAAQLAREYEANRRAITNTAGNSLYAGSTVNAQRGASRQYDEGFNRLTAAAARSKADYEGGVGRTNRDYQQGLAAIKEGAINRALSTEPAPLAPGSGVARARRRGIRMGAMGSALARARRR